MRESRATGSGIFVAPLFERAMECGQYAIVDGTSLVRAGVQIAFSRTCRRLSLIAAHYNYNMAITMRIMRQCQTEIEVDDVISADKKIEKITSLS